MRSRASAPSAPSASLRTSSAEGANRLYNSLAFPGLFRAALDVRAAAITDPMIRAAAEALAEAGAGSDATTGSCRGWMTRTWCRSWPRPWLAARSRRRRAP